jgi:S1-C subfamily serine protease
VAGSIAALALAVSGCGSDNGGVVHNGRGGVKDAVDRGSASVVGLSGKVGDDTFAGSAFVLDAERGLVVTNAHVTWGASSLRAVLSDGSEVRGQIAAEAPCDDLAVISLDPVPSNIEAADLGSAKSVQPGDEVTALGFSPASHSGRKLVATQGNVAVSAFESRIDRRLPELPTVIEHQAPVVPAESGGPLMNAEGQVVGMNSIVGSADDAHGQPPFYAIATDRIKERYSELKRSQSGRYVGWNDAHRCHRPLERLARELHHGYKTEDKMAAEEPPGAMHDEKKKPSMHDDKPSMHDGG